MPKTLHKEMKITVCSLSKNKNDKPDWIYEITENGEIVLGAILNGRPEKSIPLLTA